MSIHECAALIADNMARQYDEAIRAAVSELWGREDWEPQELIGRAERVTASGHETLIVDGVALLRFGPITFSLPGDAPPYLLSARRTVERIARREISKMPNEAAKT